MQKIVSVFLAGDSTMQTYDREHAPQAGWGQYIADFFSEEVRFINRAILLIDLMSKSLAYYASAGYEEARTFFMVSVNGTDHTHFTETGAERIAALVAEGVKELQIGLSPFTKSPRKEHSA